MPKRNPVMHMVRPGRRSLGEDWLKETIYVTPDGQYEVESEVTTAPADNAAIYVPAMGNLSYEVVDYLLEYKRKDQEYRKSHGLPIRRGVSHKEINQLFQDWMELKKRRFKGQTQSGPAQTFQRERFG